MKVVLRSDVDQLGQKGDIVEVADGYGRNYLVPRGLAIVANRGSVRQAEAMRRSREQREQREREVAHALAARLASEVVLVGARAGEGGRLFGSVTAADIADAVQAQLGVELDRRKLHLDEPLKVLGSAEVPARLHHEVTATVRVEVVPR